MDLEVKRFIAHAQKKAWRLPEDAQDRLLHPELWFEGSARTQRASSRNLIPATGASRMEWESSDDFFCASRLQMA